MEKSNYSGNAGIDLEPTFKRVDLEPAIKIPDSPSPEDMEEEANEALIQKSIEVFGLSGLYAGKFKQKKMDFLSPLKKPQQIILPEPNEIDGVETFANTGDGVESFNSIAAIYYSVILRLDIDRSYPQNVASGSIISPSKNIHWIANLRQSVNEDWKGDIWYKHGDITEFPYTGVAIKIGQSLPSSARRAVITFSGEGLTERSFSLKFESRYFHNVEFEYDYEEGVKPVTSIKTFDHPNRPATLPRETLSIEKVFRRAGFNVRKSGGDSSIPSALKGADGSWSDMEMHDAMQTYWSKFRNAPQWSLWVFFAQQHDEGSSLGGIMFDDIGSQHRQGTAIFNDSFIADAPPADTSQEAWVARMKFWTAVHEMGHSFNLAHSWQKALGNRWLPTLANEPAVRSFMNYPFRVTGGETMFFSDFEYRFSNSELLYLRHAPPEFVQMGNANWFENHAFEAPAVLPDTGFQLIVRTNRDSNEFEFLEPVRIELKLKNNSQQPLLVKDTALNDEHNLTIIVKRAGSEAKVYRPFANRCQQSKSQVLNPGESIYGNVLVSVGKDGWLIDEPGYYHIQARIQTNQSDVISEPLKIRVTPPRNYDAAYISQDYFSNDVGRVLYFTGSRYFDKVNDVLRDLSERLPDSKAAIHANLTLANPLTKNYKVLDFSAGDASQILPAAELNGAIKVHGPDINEANKLFSNAFKLDEGNLTAALSSLGHIKAHQQINKYTKVLLDEGDNEKAKKVQEDLLTAFSERKVISKVTDAIRNELNKIKV